MKKVLIALGIIVVLVAGGFTYVYLNLDELVETAIETAGSRALGTQVAVGSVALNLTGGTAEIYDFTIANPQGFTQGDMLRFSELSVGLDIQNISAESIHVLSVVSRDPCVLYESRDGMTNFDAISSRFDSGEPAEPAEDPGSQPRVIVDDILIENISGTLMDDRLPNPVEVSLGDIELQNLDGTPADLASQVMAQILSQVGRRAAEALVSRVTDLLGNSEELQNRVDEGRQRLEEEVGGALDRVGNLFGGGDDDEN